MRPIFRLRAAVLLAAVLALAPGTVVALARPVPLATPLQVRVAHAQLAHLAVRPAGSLAGYARERFPHWDQVGDGCDVRDRILRRDALRVSVGADCRITGRWRDPYGGILERRAGDLDVDHVVPLAEAWRSGARAWTTARRERFANDPRGLLAVDDGLNQSKGDRGPDDWLPPRRAFWVTYAVRWVRVKARYRLSVTPAERGRLVRLLARRSSG